MRDGLLDAIGLGEDDDEATTGDEAEQRDPADQLLRGLLNQRRNRNQETTDEPEQDPQ